MKFDVVLSNPPFQDRVRRKRTPHKLWIEFTELALARQLTPGGLLLQVSPASFSSPSNRVLALMRRHQTQIINFDVAHHFPKVGSSFAWYAIENRPSSSATKLVAGGVVSEVTLDEGVLWLPTDLTAEGWSIHRKVMFETDEKLDVRHDYVTGHNIRLGSTLSKERTDVHVYPMFHTNRQVWWSSVKQDWADQPKVMWTRSGYTRPFADHGTMGGTDMVYFVVCDSAEQADVLAHNLNLMLFRYIFSTAKWSGFGNELVFEALPQVPTSRKLSDRQLCDFFGLSSSEREHLRRWADGLPPVPSSSPDVSSQLGLSDDPRWEEVRVRVNSHAYMEGVERTAARVAATGEVFTPTDLVIEMMRSQPLEVWAPGRTVLDPACGDGQFLAAAKWAKVVFFGLSEAEASADLYGVDIMRDNVDLCRRRLGGGTVVMGNTLAPDSRLPGQSDEEFQVMLELHSQAPQLPLINVA